MINETNIWPLFRNDDLSSDTELSFFKEFCSLFDSFEFAQLHGVSIWGPIGNPEGKNSLFARGNNGIRKYCNKHISENEEIIDFINNRKQDEIGLHGYKHISYAHSTYDEQKEDIEKCIEECQKLFPDKAIKILIPPFNATNNNTWKICNQLGLTINDASNSILLETIEGNAEPQWLNKTLRYHYWKYIKKVSLKKLQKQLKQINELLHNKYLTEKGDV